ncbi:MAG: hypothetical protein WDZ80_01735 [Candidatus Paceibacterota bacterium]
MKAIVENIDSRWEQIRPFERSKDKTIEHLKDGEIEYEVCKNFVHTVVWDGDPPNIVKLDSTEIKLLKDNFLEFRDNKSLYREKCFLWVIDRNALKIVREKIRNVKRTHDPDFVCHTNLTNGKMAYIGGEVLFGEDDNIYINYFSDRYGGQNTPDELWEAAKNIFRDLGYTNTIDLIEYI